jgi:hypothetical protein
MHFMRLLAPGILPSALQPAAALRRMRLWRLRAERLWQLRAAVRLLASFAAGI